MLINDKAKFFAQYWGQRIWVIGSYTRQVDDHIQSDLIAKGF